MKGVRVRKAERFEMGVPNSNLDTKQRTLYHAIFKELIKHFLWTMSVVSSGRE